MSKGQIPFFVVTIIIALVILIAFVILIKDSLWNPTKKIGAEFQYCDSNGVYLDQFDSIIAKNWVNRDWKPILLVYEDYKNCFNPKQSSVAYYAFQNAATHCSAYPELNSVCQKIQGDLA